ncbi:MAG: crosslink repair DNA glycosylase YcaQ family protein [Candidatus Rokuibacteriota bacterium]
MTHPVFPLRAVTALFLERQHLRRPRARRLSPARLTRFVEDVGGLQMDSINVLERAHYLTVWSRFGPYDRARLDRLVYRRRLFLEYWAHAACLVPASMLPWWKRAMLDYRLRHTGWSNWLRRNAKLLAFVTDAVRANGPMGHAEMEARRPRRGRAGWWDWRPVQHAIHYLWMTGVLTVHSRRHFQKRFDLMERVAAAAPDAPAVSSEQFLRWHVERSLHAMGAATELDLSRYLTYPRLPRAARRAALRAMVAEGLVTEIALEGLPSRWLVLTRDLPALRRAGRRRTVSDGTTLLAPFDSLLWHRDRVSRLFGFDYRIEVYTPGPKRVHGYYTLPILHHGHLIGRLDAKAHRDARYLEVRHVHFEPWVARARPPAAGWGQVDGDSVVVELADAMASLAVFVGADRVTLGRVTPGRLRGALRRALTSSGRRSAPPSPPAPGS